MALAFYNPLAERVAKNLRFHDIATLARNVRGGALGMDYCKAFRAENGPIKAQFANWLVMQEWADANAILRELPALEDMARKYYEQRKQQQPGRRGPATPAAPAKPAKPATPVIEAVPMPQEPQPAAPVKLDASVAEILEQARKTAASMDAEKQAALLATVRERLDAIEARVNQARPLIITQQGAPNSVTLDRQHKDFLTLLKLCKARNRSGGRFNIWMTGPAGSGKTTAAMNVAKALSLPFYFTGAINDEFKLSGFIDAHGNLVRTAFREAFENGGVFLLDEIDGCHPGVILALNAALANGTCDFPDGNIKRHDDCVIIAAANTWGLGATHKYVGRNKLDAASLDRFKPIAWDYDEAMERDLSGNVEWCKKVQAMRASMMRQGIEAVISPRATYDGADMLAQGFDEATVIDTCIRKGMPDDAWGRITRGVY